MITPGTSATKLTPLQARILYAMHDGVDYSRDDLRAKTGQRVHSSPHIRPLQFLGFIEPRPLSMTGARRWRITAAGIAWKLRK